MGKDYKIDKGFTKIYEEEAHGKVIYIYTYKSEYLDLGVGGYYIHGAFKNVTLPKVKYYKKYSTALKKGQSFLNQGF